MPALHSAAEDGFEDVSRFIGICQSIRLLTRCRALSETVMSHTLLERHALKIFKIANKLIILSDVKTDVLMTRVALS